MNFLPQSSTLIATIDSAQNNASSNAAATRLDNPHCSGIVPKNTQKHPLTIIEKIISTKVKESRKQIADIVPETLKKPNKKKITKYPRIREVKNDQSHSSTIP